MLSSRSWALLLLIAVVLFASNAHAFGAGNIASISAIEGKNWRHGDIEDLLKQVTCIRHHKWNSMMIKRAYFGNWLRDYSQAVDVGALKKANSETIRILVWLLSFLGFGYATAEFEVTAARLGTYRPEEHIDNPKDYADNEDARKYDPRLRGPVRQIELDIDPETGMKNYIANGKGDWATSAAFVKYSFEKSIHHGRLYTNGSGMFSKGKDDDLAEALRLLGQGLHCLEDFGAHTNYIELALVELGFRNVFPLVGTQTGISLRGKHTFPLVTGTFGMVDFYHSVLGEATDHFTQSEVNEMDNALGVAQQSASSSNPLTTLIKLLAKVPGTRELCVEAEQLQAASQRQAQFNSSRGLDVGFGGDGARGVGDFTSATRAGPTDYNAYPPPQNYSSYGQQQGYNQAPPGQYGPPSTGQYGQPPAANWGPPQSHQQHSELPGSTPGQQWNNPPLPQSYDSNPTGPPGAYGSQQSYNQASQPNLGAMPTVQPPPTPSAPDTRPAPQGTQAAPTGLPGVPDFDPAKTIQQIYPILAFRDRVVRTISSIIEKIPGLEALVDRIVETLTVFILSLLAPFIRPILKGMTTSLSLGSEGVVNSSARAQYEVFDNPRSSDPTHSMLSKDHFSNMLNEPAGLVAGEILKYIAPRVLYAWEHTDVPVDRVLADIDGVFHHPAIRDERNECHRNMYEAVRRWTQTLPRRGDELNDVLSMDSVRKGKNHKAGVNNHSGHGSSMAGGGPSHQGGGQQQQAGGFSGMVHQAEGIAHMFGGGQQQHHSNPSSQSGIGGMLDQVSNLASGFTGQKHHGSGGGGNGGGLNNMLGLASKLPIPGVQNVASTFNKFNKYSHFMPGSREIGAEGVEGSREMGDAYYNVYESSPLAAQIGGGAELRDAAQRGTRGDDRSPSPMPLAAPAGYESYGQGSGGYDGVQYTSSGTYGSQSGSYNQYGQGQGPGQGQGQGYVGGSNDSYYRS